MLGRFERIMSLAQQSLASLEMSRQRKIEAVVEIGRSEEITSHGLVGYGDTFPRSVPLAPTHNQ